MSKSVLMSKPAARPCQADSRSARSFSSCICKHISYQNKNKQIKNMGPSVSPFSSQLLILPHPNGSRIIIFMIILLLCGKSVTASFAAVKDARTFLMPTFKLELLFFFAPANGSVFGPLKLVDSASLVGTPNKKKKSYLTVEI